MIKILRPDIDSIAKTFAKRIEDSVVKNKLGGKVFSAGNKLQMLVRELYSCTPEQLKSKSREFEKYVTIHHHAEIGQIKETYFDYETTIDYKKDKESHAYWLVTKLNVRVCPYCNRNYTHTIHNSRPQLDHFLCQEHYPYLSLSFFNLIPCCPICNHIKKSQKAGVHPYVDDFGDDCTFKVDNIGDCILGDSNNTWGVSFTPFSCRMVKYYRNIKVYSLIEFYNQHKDYISEIVQKAQAYNDSYYETLMETFKNKGLSKQEMNVLIFGCHVDPKDFELRPMSKLTKDVLDQIGVPL